MNQTSNTFESRSSRIAQGKRRVPMVSFLNTDTVG